MLLVFLDFFDGFQGEGDTGTNFTLIIGLRNPGFDDEFRRKSSTDADHTGNVNIPVVLGTGDGPQFTGLIIQQNYPSFW